MITILGAAMTTASFFFLSSFSDTNARRKRGDLDDPFNAVVGMSSLAVMIFCFTGLVIELVMHITGA